VGQLDGRVAIVTGAGQNIGRAIALRLAGEGAAVAVVDRDAGRAEAVRDEIVGTGGRALAVIADVSDEDDVGRGVDQVVEELGGLDILVNNAGGPPPGIVLPRGPFLDGTDEDWQSIFDFNLHAVVRMTRAALPHLLARGGGAIVNVSTALVRQPTTNNYEYAAAKAALTHIGKALSEEFGPRGVRVNTVSPGVVRTPWWTDEGGVADMIAGRAGMSAADVLDKMLPEALRLTTGRFVEPQEVADMITLLCSPRSGSTTGADFVVDGGLLKEL
jgi:NAD(P)-dependent dehydrogenase (short-subunit alcohol dehydrogenase family)